MTGRSQPPNRPPGAGGQYFESTPGSASRPSQVRLDLPERSLTLRTDRGVFSPDRVDTGTKVLLVELPDLAGLPAGDVVDLGCGYGPIACTLALRLPGRRVWAVEVNERARGLCAANAATAGVADRVDVVGPDGVPSERPLAAIVSNPPIRIGKAALHDLLAEWLGRLVPGGEAWLVVQKHLGADSLARWLGEQGWEATRAHSRKGYRILRVRRP